DPHLRAQPRQVGEEGGIALGDGLRARDREAIAAAQRRHRQRLRQTVVVVCMDGRAASDTLRMPPYYHGVGERLDLTASVLQLSGEIADAVALLQAQRRHVGEAAHSLREAGGSYQHWNAVYTAVAVHYGSIELRARSQHQHSALPIWCGEKVCTQPPPPHHQPF